jgi:hypothetical protein
MDVQSKQESVEVRLRQMIETNPDFGFSVGDAINNMSPVHDSKEFSEALDMVFSFLFETNCKVQKYFYFHVRNC